MADINMNDKLAIMAQADVIITVNGAVFTVPATVPFTTSAEVVSIPNGTVLAIMYNATAPSGKMLQVFSFDEIITVS